MNEAQYERDIEIIEAATAGKWSTKYSSNGPRILVRPECMQDMISIVDAEYIAHFNPSYTRQLVTELEELRKRLAESHELLYEAIEYVSESGKYGALGLADRIREVLP